MSSQHDDRLTDRPERPDPQAARHPAVPTQRARQGVTGHNVRYVLAVGLAAIIIGFAVLYIVYAT